MIVYVALSALEVIMIVVVGVTHIQDRVLADDFFPLIFVFLIVLNHLVMSLYPLRGVLLSVFFLGTLLAVLTSFHLMLVFVSILVLLLLLIAFIIKVLALHCCA